MTHHDHTKSTPHNQHHTGHGGHGGGHGDHVAQFRKLFWINHVVKPMKMKVEFTATVDGDAMSGKVKAGFMGSFPFTGVRDA